MKTFNEWLELRENVQGSRSIMITLVDFNQFQFLIKDVRVSQGLGGWDVAVMGNAANAGGDPVSEPAAESPASINFIIPHSHPGVEKMMGQNFRSSNPVSQQSNPKLVLYFKSDLDHLKSDRGALKVRSISVQDAAKLAAFVNQELKNEVLTVEGLPTG
jgi:hypothetical protein